MNQAELSQLVSRIHRMELLAVFLCLAFVALAVFSFTKRRYSNQQIVLRDNKGNVLVTLGPNAQGETEFSLTDKNQTSSWNLSFCEDGSPRLGAFDQNGKFRLGFGFGATGSALNFLDEQGDHRLIAGIDADGIPRINLMDKQGKTRLQLGLRPAGDPYLQLLDGEEKSILFLGTSDPKEAVLIFYDKDKQQRIRVGFGAGGQPFLHAFQEDELATSDAPAES